MSVKAITTAISIPLGLAALLASGQVFGQAEGDVQRPSFAAPSKAVPTTYRTGLEAMLARVGGGNARIVLVLSQNATNPDRGNAAAVANFDAPQAEAERGKAALAAALRTAKVADFKPVAGLPMISATLNAEQLRALSATGLIAGYEEDSVSYPTLAQSVPLINAPALWSANIKGQNQVVAILDTGVMSNHQFLAGRLAGEACFSGTGGGVAVCSNGSTASGAGAPCSLTNCNHGTHVAGIAVGRQNSSASFNGVAPEAKYLAVQVFTNINGGVGAYDSDIYAALQHVKLRKQAGLAIASINMSLGGGAYTTACAPSQLETLISQLKTIGVATVISSGNNGYANAVGWPACAPSAVTVGASTKTDALAGFSNSSSQIDLLAPGVGINSSVNSGTGAYAAFAGTSMAAPHVAGAYALLRQRFPCYPNGVIEADLFSTGVPIAHPTNGQTYRRINLQAAQTLLQTRWRQYVCARAVDVKVKDLQVNPM